MKKRAVFDLPDELEPVLARARNLEWITLAAMLSISLAIGLVMGNSQSMKAAWIEDLLSCVTPTAFLISAHFRNRPPNERFPYGHHRSVSIAFLTGAVALTTFGLLILVDSLHGLLTAHHPSIGASVVLGRVVWSGWVMIGVLLLSTIPPLVLGRLKLRLASRIHDKTLKADADMNKADWQTALAGSVGIAGIGLGWWWADAAAGAFISASIVKDGASNLREVVLDLMDAHPRTIEGELSSVPERVRSAVRALPWVREVEVRMREEGHVFNGELFLKISECRDLAARRDEVQRVAEAVDWRVHDLVIEFEDAVRRG